MNARTPLDRENLLSLVQKARDGSQEALDALKHQYAPLIEGSIARHTLPDMSLQDQIDIREEANIIFSTAVCNYNSSAEGVEFGLYAKICLENGLVSYIRSYFRRKKNPILSLENVEVSVGGNSEFLQSIVDAEDTANLVKFIQSKLSDYENRVWWMYVSGMSASAIATTLGNTEPKSVSNAIYRIRKKLRGILPEHINSDRFSR